MILADSEGKPFLDLELESDPEKYFSTISAIVRDRMHVERGVVKTQLVMSQEAADLALRIAFGREQLSQTEEEQLMKIEEGEQ